ncbi:restriction endonuclease subunit S [Capnocytophaga leadbetteri]|uniref:restriction endonuclease subunit S n=1 Tax=Capnocytophaga leadbetteri TaxID=327575 RepID=UPI0026EE6D6C|nr:restriction endonuclease subunit S [Capnocytophaga leadbetteri]
MTQEPKIFPYIARLLQGTEVVWKPLGEVAEIINGYAFQSGKYSDEGLRVIRISDVQKGKISDENLRYYPIEYINKLGRAVLFKNDLVMSLTGNVGRVAVLNESHLPAGLNQRVACIRPKNNIFLTRFLFHFFDQNSFEQEAMQNATGGGQKNMSTTWLSKLLIPLPPLSVQQEIVRILDKFTQLEAELEAELDCRKRQYEYYRNNLLSYEGNEVEWKTLGEVGEIRMCKRILKEQTSDYGGVPFYKIGTFGKEADAYISKELFNEYRSKYNYPNVGDILISASGTIGRTVIFDGKEAYFQDSNIVWIENDQKKVLNKYLFYCYQIAKWNISEGGTIQRLYNENLRKTLIPIPYPNNPEKSLEEQNHIVTILDKFDTLVNSISEGLPKEIALRRKQYEYYREKLLSFPKE